MTAHIVRLFILLLPGFSAAAQDYRIFIDPSSNIKVNGSTNANKFSFQYTDPITLNNAVHVVRDHGKLVLSNGVIKLKVKAFDSGNGMMNSDFRKMLKEPENPTIEVELATIMPAWRDDELWFQGDVEIHVTMNKVQKKFLVMCQVENPGSILIFGKKSLLLSDFGLIAPTRMLGMVKVNDAVDFDFALRFDTDK